MSKFYIEKPSNFEIECEVSTVFMEYDRKILLLLRSRCELSPHTWGIPGGKLEKNETPIGCLIREIQEELNIHTHKENLKFHQSVYVDHPKIKYRLHLYVWKLNELPQITLNPSEHIDYLWQPINEFSKLSLLEGQKEAFILVYGNTNC